MNAYDTDRLIWSSHLAALVWRIAAGERVNDHEDWENVAEEPAVALRACDEPAIPLDLSFTEDQVLGPWFPD